MPSLESARGEGETARGLQNTTADARASAVVEHSPRGQNRAVNNQFSASFSALPALNAGTFDALILMFSPVRGLRPVRAERLRTTKVPKPTSDTSSPFFSALRMISVVASSARPASAL